MPFNVQTYLQQHPELMTAWNDQSTGNQQFYSSLDDYVRDSAGVLHSGDGQYIDSTGKAVNTGASGGNAGAATTSTQTPTQLGSSLAGLLGGSSTTDPAQQALAAGANRAIAGGNSNQVQGGVQTGQYGTTNTTAQQGTQNTTGATTGQQQTTGTTSNIGQQQGVTSTTGQQQGQSTTNVVDQYGLGNLASSLTGTAAANDAARTNYLSGVVQNGDPNLQYQTTKAVNQALSGPGLTGAGDSARARAAGYAAADVAGNSTANQLAASNQLGGSTASGTAIQQASPLLGSSTASNQTSLGQTLSDLASSNTGTSIQNLLSSGTSSQQGTTGQTGSSATSGTASGSNLGVATGQVPQQQVQSGSGCYVCTAFVERGELTPSLVRHAVVAKLRGLARYETALRGYMVYGPLLARLVLKSKLAARLLLPISRAVLYAELRVGHPKLPWKPYAAFWHSVFTTISLPFGSLARIAGYSKTPKSMAWLLEKHNLNFKDLWA